MGLTGDLISGTGMEGVYVHDSELTIADGVIEQSGLNGLAISKSRLVRAANNYFDNNGKALPPSGTPPYGVAVSIADATHVTLCDNTFHRSGQYAQGSATTAHVYFAGTDDSISLCGNVYMPDEEFGNVLIRPDYAFDADPTATVTNLTVAI